MYYVIYISVASELMNDDELENILASSRGNNEKNKLTGVLLFGNGTFIQLLEGERQDVDQTFRKIKTDRRHLDITVIAWGELTERCFPEWYMGFNSIRPESYPMMKGFLENTKKAVQKNDCALPVKLLQSFVRKNRLDL
jgi:hypothetical protein